MFAGRRARPERRCPCGTPLPLAGHHDESRGGRVLRRRLGELKHVALVTAQACRPRRPNPDRRRPRRRAADCRRRCAQSRWRQDWDRYSTHWSAPRPAPRRFDGALRRRWPASLRRQRAWPGGSGGGGALARLGRPFAPGTPPRAIEKSCNPSATARGGVNGIGVKNPP